MEQQDCVGSLAIELSVDLVRDLDWAKRSPALQRNPGRGDREPPRLDHLGGVGSRPAMTGSGGHELDVGDPGSSVNPLQSRLA